MAWIFTIFGSKQSQRRMLFHDFFSNERNERKVPEKFEKLAKFVRKFLKIHIADVINFLETPLSTFDFCRDDDDDRLRSNNNDATRQGRWRITTPKKGKECSENSRAYINIRKRSATIRKQSKSVTKMIGKRSKKKKKLFEWWYLNCIQKVVTNFLLMVLKISKPSMKLGYRL